MPRFIILDMPMVLVVRPMTDSPGKAKQNLATPSNSKSTIDASQPKKHRQVFEKGISLTNQPW
jgi:hypothetical protein